MASGYVQCMNYAEGLHFSAFHSYSIRKFEVSSFISVEVMTAQNCIGVYRCNTISSRHIII